MTVALSSPLEIGQLVEVRSRRWVVNEVVASTLPAPPLEPSREARHSISFRCFRSRTTPLAKNCGSIWEIEPGATVVEKVGPAASRPVSTRPKSSTRFSTPCAGGRLPPPTCGTSSRRSGRASTSRTTSSTPSFRAIQMPRVNLLIADDVGLGKTIEAGLVALELIIRHRARRMLVVCPASLQVQWRDQMRDKFGLDFRIVDSELMRDLRRRRGIHVNPWIALSPADHLDRLPQARAAAAAVSGKPCPPRANRSIRGATTC